MRRLIEMLDLCLNLIGEKGYRRTNFLASFLYKIYAPVARQRVKHFWYRFPVETKLAKILRPYARQG